MNPIAAIKGLEKEIVRINLQGTSSYVSVNIIQSERILGVDIEIIKQLQKIKPKITFYEPTAEKSRVSMGVQRTRQISGHRILASDAMEEITANTDRTIQQGIIASANPGSKRVSTSAS